MVFFFGREMRNIYRERGSYFTQFWNLIELFIILVSALAVAFYFYREKISRDLFAKMPSKEPQNYISFQFAAYWDQTYSGIVYFDFPLKICLLKQVEYRRLVISMFWIAVRMHVFFRSQNIALHLLVN